MSREFSVSFDVDVSSNELMAFHAPMNYNQDLAIMRFSIGVSGGNATYAPLVVKTGLYDVFDAGYLRAIPVVPSVPTTEFINTFFTAGYSWDVGLDTGPLGTVLETYYVRPNRSLSRDYGKGTVPTIITTGDPNVGGWSISLTSATGPLHVKGTVAFKNITGEP